MNFLKHFHDKKVPATPPESTSDSIEPKTANDTAPHKLTRGGRNLIILGVASILIAILATTVGLLIYHVSGDIYLDRSRPGFLPDEEEVEQNIEQKPAEYQFESSGKLTPETIDEYIEHYNKELQAIDAYEKPFDENVLSDEYLGIPSDSD